MGREIKRVPLDFVHPVCEIWPGYLMPAELDLPPCTDCIGVHGEPDGYTVEARAIANTFYAHQVGGREDLAWHDKLGQAEVDNLIAESRCRTWRNGAWHTDPLTAEQVNADQASGLFSGRAHDGINRWVLIGFRCKQLGITQYCSTCTGELHAGTPEQVAAAEAWDRTEPPAGEGWQLWETTSEGSPISAVHDSPESLARWMATDYEWGAQKRGTWSYEDALRWIVGPGWAPTFIASSGVSSPEPPSSTVGGES